MVKINEPSILKTDKMYRRPKFNIKSYLPIILNLGGLLLGIIGNKIIN